LRRLDPSGMADRVLLYQHMGTSRMIAAIATSDLQHLYIALTAIVLSLALGGAVFGVAMIGAPR
jgi:hypothetical protein